MISIVIPSFNAEKYIKEAIDSALSQKFRDFEVVVIDDGSTDRTREIILSYGSHIRYEFGPNRGVSAARNRGTSLALGDWILYLDADDMLMPDTLEKRMKALAGDVDVVYSNWQKLIQSNEGSFASGEVVTSTIENIHPDREIALLTDFWAPPSAYLCRRSIVDQCGGWKEWLLVVEDARFFLDLAIAGARFIHDSGVGVLYRVHSEGLSKRKHSLFAKACLRNALDLETHWRSHGGISSQRKIALLKVYTFVARSSYEKDRATFHEACSVLKKLEPSYCPSHPKFLALTARLVGYENAEFFAALYRAFKVLPSKHKEAETGLGCPER